MRRKPLKNTTAIGFVSPVPNSYSYLLSDKMISVKTVLAKDPACSANWAKGVIVNENGRSEPIKYNALDGDRYGYVSKTISEVI